MIRKFIILIIPFLIFLIAACHDNNQDQSEIKASADNVFAAIDYDKVIAYSYNGEGGNEIINSNGKLADRIKKQTQLDRSQIIRLTNFLCDRSTYGGETAACFDPHFGIVFYRANEPKAYVSICLDCNYLVSSIKIPNSKGGFSDEGIKEMESLEIEFNSKN